MQYNSKNKELSLKMGLDLAYLIRNEIEPVVFMCVGSDKVVGDSLAPIVGEYLTKKFKIKAYVYGTLKNPITAQNVVSAYNFIKIRHAKSKIIMIDATLSDVEKINFVKLENNGIIPAGYFKNGNKIMGDISILGVVGSNILTEQTFVSGVRINLVVGIAFFIATAINFAIDFAKHLQENNVKNFAIKGWFMSVK